MSKDAINISSSFPRVGLNLSTDPLAFREGDYSFMLNGNIHGQDGFNASARMLPGNVKAFSLKQGYYIIGSTQLINDKECLFLVEPVTGAGSIGISDGKAYTESASSPKLGFDITRQIQAVFDKDFSDKWIVVWTMEGAPVRYMDLLNPPMLNGELDVEALSVFRQSSYPDIRISDVVGSGTLKAGSYYFCVQYADENGNGLTSFSTPVGPVPVYRDSISSRDFIAGSPDREITNKAIRVVLSNLDQSYRYYNLIAIKSFDGIKEPFVIATNPISQLSYLYTGNTETETPLSIEEVITPAVSYDSAKTISLSDGVLLLGNLKSNPEYNLQPYFSKVQVQWQTKKELYRGPESGYANPLNCAYEVQYRRNEIYAFGIVLRWKDGSKSRVYYFINREKNKRPDGSVIGRNYDSFNQPITSGEWDSYAYRNNPDIFETGAVPERWRVYNTALPLGDQSPGGEGPSLYGEFAYWESEDTYPNDPLVWGVNAGKPIRHFKMPDHIAAPLTDGEGLTRKENDPVYIHKLGIRLLNIEEVLETLPAEVKNKMAGWEIVRADRTGNKSVIASGLIYNMWFQNWKGDGHNYVADGLVTSFGVTGTEDDIRVYQNYPHNDLNSDYYYKKQAIGAETKFEDNVPHDRYLKNAFTMVSPDVAFNRVALVGNQLVIHGNFYGVSKTTQHRLTPYPLLKVRGDNADSVLYHTVSVGFYNNWVKPKFGQARRQVQDCLYVPFNATVSGSTLGKPVHNVTRESTVMIHLAADLENPTIADTSRTHLTDPDYGTPCSKSIKASPVYRTVSGYYASIVNPVPNQYGNVFSARFVYTNYDNFLVKNNTLIFGGDCFLVKYSIKRQLAMFQNLQTYMNWADNEEGVDLNMTMTIYGTRYTYEANRRNPANGSGTNTECADPREVQNLPAIMTGIPVFFCESDVNTALRLNGPEPWSTFYPNLKDGSLPLNRWAGVEYLNHDNDYVQNKAYSESNSLVSYVNPDPYLNPNKSGVLNFDTRVIFSLKGSPESRFNNLLVFKPLNYYDFRRDYGQLWDIRDIGNGRVLFRFEHALYIGSKYINIPVEQDKIVLGTGQLFQTDPGLVLRSDGGYAGTHAQWAFNNTPFGAFFIDPKRGFVFQYSQNLGDVSANEADAWFMRNLPLRLPQDIPAFANIDNPANPDGIGFCSAYDHENKLWILTKRDYALIDKTLASSFEMRNGKLLLNGYPVSLSDRTLFEDKSWTFIYDPPANRWVSWASFIPLFYSGFNRRFFSYIAGDDGAWEHNRGLPRTFYGRRHPFIIESVLTFEGGIQNVVKACTWLSRASNIVNGVIRGELQDETFNKGIFYTSNQSSGLRHLIVQDENNLSTLFVAEQSGSDFAESYLRVRDDMWQINDVYDVVKNPEDPLFSTAWQDIRQDYYIDKIVNHSNMDYQRDYREEVEMRGYWLKYRLIYDKDKDIQMHYYFTSSLQQVSVK